MGLVSNLGRPEGNITGFTSYSLRLEPKRLELLRDLLPDVATIALLINPGSASTELQLSSMRSAAQSVGVQAFELGVKSYDHIEAAFATAKEKHAGAIFVSSDAFFTNQRDRIVALAARHAVPAMYAFREFVSDGGLISYGASVADGYRQAGVYIGRILSGTKPADLPVQQPTKFELVINLKTAAELGITVPPAFLDAPMRRLSEAARVHMASEHRGGCIPIYCNGAADFKNLACRHGPFRQSGPARRAR